MSEKAGYPPFFTEDGNPMKLYEKVGLLTPASVTNDSQWTDHSRQGPVSHIFRRASEGAPEESAH